MVFFGIFFFFSFFFRYFVILFCCVFLLCCFVCFILFQWTFKEGFVCTLAKNTHDELFFFFQSMGGKRSTFCHQICHCFMLFFIYCVPATCLYVCSLSWIAIVVFKAASGIFCNFFIYWNIYLIIVAILLPTLAPKCLLLNFSYIFNSITLFIFLLIVVFIF